MRVMSSIDLFPKRRNTGYDFRTQQFKERGKIEDRDGMVQLFFLTCSGLAGLVALLWDRPALSTLLPNGMRSLLKSTNNLLPSMMMMMPFQALYEKSPLPSALAEHLKRWWDAATNTSWSISEVNWNATTMENWQLSLLAGPVLQTVADFQKERGTLFDIYFVLIFLLAAMGLKIYLSIRESLTVNTVRASQIGTEILKNFKQIDEVDFMRLIGLRLCPWATRAEQEVYVDRIWDDIKAHLGRDGKAEQKVRAKTLDNIWRLRRLAKK